MSLEWLADHGSFLVTAMELGFRSVVANLMGLLPQLATGGAMGLWIVAILLAWETLRPWRKQQRRLRPGVGLDVFYTLASFLLFHALIGTPVFQTVELAFREGLGTMFGAQLAAVIDLKDAPGWLQYLLIFLYVDLISYVGHVMLHRFGPLWTLHKVHHSAQQLDVLNALRQHWGERLYYDFLAYVPMALVGFTVEQTAVAVAVSLFFCLATHANIRLPLGPARYVFNNPQLHLWHHAREVPHDRNVNYGSALSLWDYLFGTVSLPDDRSEIPLGFEGDETFPTTLVRQQIHPLDRWLPAPRRWARPVALGAGLSLATLATAVVLLGEAVPKRFLHALHLGYREQVIALLDEGAPAAALEVLDAATLVDRPRLERLMRLRARSEAAGFDAPALTRLLQIARGDANLRFRVGHALLSTEERLEADTLDAAFASAQLLVLMQPRSARSHFLLGACHRRRGRRDGDPEDFRKALAAFSRAAALDADYPRVHQARDAVLERLREHASEGDDSAAHPEPEAQRLART